MALDLFASVRSTALISLVAASLTAPVVVQADFAADARAKVVSAAQVARNAARPKVKPQVLVAGGVAFEIPRAWDQLGAGAASRSVGRAANGAGTVVSALCPSGENAGRCSGDAKLTFLTYSGKARHDLPALSLLDGQLDTQLAQSYPGFKPAGATTRTSSDGSIRYLDYEFSWVDKGAVRMQRLAAFRNDDGSGVVVVSSGPGVSSHEQGIDAFVDGASSLVVEDKLAS